MPDWLVVDDDQRLLFPTLVKAFRSGNPHQWATDDGGAELKELMERAALLGAFAIGVPESAGGGGWSERPTLDAALAAGILGSDLAPIPLPDLTAAMHLLASCPASSDRDALLEGHAAGERLVITPFRIEDADGRSTRPQVRKDRLTSACASFYDLPVAATLLVPVRQADQIRLLTIDLEEARRQASEPSSLDLTRRVRRLDLADLPVSEDRSLPPIADADVRRAVSLAGALVCVEVVAGIEVLLQQAVEYSLTRKAFGAPIASFQSIKHLLADARMQLEGAKAVSLAAVEAFAGGDEWAAEAASIAKAYADERAVPIAMDCLQVFGGIGFSWEHHLHLYLRRAAARCGSFGTRAEHLRAIDELHLAEWEVA